MGQLWFCHGTVAAARGFTVFRDGVRRMFGDFQGTVLVTSDLLRFAGQEAQGCFVWGSAVAVTTT